VSARDTVESYLSAQGIPFERTDDSWVLQLRGERKHAIPVLLRSGERTLSVRSFFMRRPIDDAGEFYRLLLGRNLRPSRLRFAADADGDVYLVGEIALEALDADTLDAVLGELLYTCDQMFDAAIAVGFGSYLEKDLTWRAAQQPPQPEQ
jgi:hypothetical protein